MSLMDWTEGSALEPDDGTFSKTFVLTERDSFLVLRRLEQETLGDHQASKYFWTTYITNPEDFEKFSKCSDPCQIFCIRQKHSYARLYITRELFSQLIERYNVFTRIWDFLYPFGFKTRESDLTNAPFRFRQLEHLKSPELGSFECVYGFQYAEVIRRTLRNRENPDYDPWSLRQSVVYQRYDSQYKRIVFVLIAPHETAGNYLEQSVHNSISRSGKLNAFDLHRILLSTLQHNWRLYVRSLEALMKATSDRVVLAQVQDDGEKLSPLTNFNINFVDRQRLKMLEDKVLDLVLIFESLHHTLSNLCDQCKKHCLQEACEGCVCASVVEELEEEKREVQVNLKKVDILQKRARGAAELLSTLLDYENALIAQENQKALNALSKETKDENSKMRLLTERATADAAAVKILTVVTLTYLPMSVVINFFSSQLIKVDDGGHVSVASGSWWFAVIAVPLTILTFGVWQLWLKLSIKSQERKQDNEDSSQLIRNRGRSVNWTSAWKYVSSVKNRCRELV